ncbi:DNA-directed RNA polymerases I and III subunit RPAC2 [Brassica napus]|nr:DNA-directed RNA polymerases I and III subunit RPAC2 [Brassica napus]
MEHGSFTNDKDASFTLAEEDHTLANAVRFMLNQDPRVTLAGYSIPHPSLECVNVRVQTTGDPAREVLKDACQELMLMNRHVRSVFDKAVSEFKVEQARLAAEEEEKKKAEEEEIKKQRDLLASMDIESD